jgi:hypothetical protein
METERWSTMLSRIVPEDADDLDPVTRGFDRRLREAGNDVFPRIDAVLRPEAALARVDAVCIGLRVQTVLPDAADRAMRLVAFAAERDVEIIVLSHVDGSGLERFGFRCERVAGATPEERATCEAQICRMWNIDLVL